MAVIFEENYDGASVGSLVSLSNTDWEAVTNVNGVGSSNPGALRFHANGARTYGQQTQPNTVDYEGAYVGIQVDALREVVAESSFTLTHFGSGADRTATGQQLTSNSDQSIQVLTLCQSRSGYFETPGTNLDITVQILTGDASTSFAQIVGNFALGQRVKFVHTWTENSIRAQVLVDNTQIYDSGPIEIAVSAFTHYILAILAGGNADAINHYGKVTKPSTEEPEPEPEEPIACAPNRLTWDKLDERPYETGLDHGVLYRTNEKGVVWNGLTSLEVGSGNGTTTPLYFDGVKYLDVQNADEFSATLSAFTYPEELLDLEGMLELGPGIYADQQMPKQFGLAFRSLTDSGYKLHILYNIVAIPNATPWATLGSSLTPMDFSWTLSSVPVDVEGLVATEHFILESENINPNLLAVIEGLVFGNNATDAFLPPIEALIYIAKHWDPRIITYDGYGGTDIIDGMYPWSHGEGLLDGGTSASPGSGVVDGGTDSSDGSIFGGDPTSNGGGELFGGTPPTSGDGYVLGGTVSSNNSEGGGEVIGGGGGDNVTGIADLVKGIGDLIGTNIPGFFFAMPGTHLRPSSVDGLYELE